MVTFSHTDQGTAAAQWNAHGLGDLEQLDLSRVFTQGTRLVVLAAHPDDETLGAGGLIHQAVKMGIEVTVLACTFGEASHPESATHSPAQLAAVRDAELGQAMALLRAEAKATEGSALALPSVARWALAFARHRDRGSAARNQRRRALCGSQYLPQ